MMTKYHSHEREQLEMLTIAHKLGLLLIFSFIYPLVGKLTFAAMNIKKLANWTW